MFFPFINEKYQEITIDGLIEFYNQGVKIARDFLEKTAMNIAESRVLQLVFMVVLQLAFGLTKGGIFSLLTSGNAEKLRVYLFQIDENFPGGSTASRRMGQILETCEKKLMELAGRFQDYFYMTVGARERALLSKEYHSSRRAMKPPLECFLGLIAPSKLLPCFTVEERGVLMPFLNALIFQNAHRISGITELIGDLKEPSFDNDVLIFLRASKLGFFGGPPGKNMIHGQFKILEGMADTYNALVNEMLVGLGMVNLTVVSTDGTNVPVDKRDKTGSIGTGSQGTFFGHKSSIACDANCIPLNCTLDTGHCSDNTLFPDTINPVKDLAHKTGQEIWCAAMDAAYSTISIVSEVESMEIVPIIDINPKNSVLLKNLKEKGQELLKLTRKAFKTTPRAFKKKFRDTLRAISEKRTSTIPLNEKKSILRALAHHFGTKILKTGLSPAEFNAAEQLRRELLSYRRKIRANGTLYEKKVGLMALVQGTIEWFLIYSIRGQNEGINGILKKRGNLIGDGQHTSWLVGGRSISARQAMDIVCIKLVACVKFMVTGQSDHYLRFIHNWRHDKSFFCIIILVIYCRETPAIK